MLSVDEALQLVLEQARAKPPQRTALADSLGLALAEDVASDVDSPPYDKSAVDGYALVAADLDGGAAELQILEEVTAGSVPQQSVAAGQATRIMTGAPIPAGAEAVVMIEQTELRQPSANSLGTVHVRPGRVVQGQNIVRRAASMHRGETVLRRGALLRPVELGVLAEVGRTHVQAIPRPTLAVLSTGNELVDVAKVPGPGHIRNSNGPMLVAAARQAGAVPVDLGVGRDDVDSLRQLIAAGLANDVLVISGGVSVGVLDLVPQVLEDLGVQQIFHRVRVKPGKPLWFGRRHIEARDTLVFGLPGNPVSSFVCFELFIRPAIGGLAGRDGATLKSVTARLSVDFVHRGDRPTYHPAQLRQWPEDATVEPLVWQGSGDLKTLTAANALAHFPAGDRAFKAGETVEVLRLD